MISTVTYALSSATLVVLVYVLYRYRLKIATNAPYPPGPKGIPLIGNIFDLSTTKPWLVLTSLRDKYGGIAYLRVPGKHILVINPQEDAFELLEKRSMIYSDRPDIPVVEMMGWDFVTAVLKYSSRWRNDRKLFQQFLRAGEAHKFRPIQVSNVHIMLRDMLNVRPRFADYYLRLSGSIIMKIVYNIDISEEEHQYYVDVAQEAEKNISKIAYLSAIHPRIVSLIEYIPAWVPGVRSLQRIIPETKILTRKMLTGPFESALKNRDPSSSMVMHLLTNASETELVNDKIRDIRDVCASAYAGGADTSVCVLETFFYAMLTSSEEQKKAQAEIDDVIGNSRLPTFDDRGSLPYVEAIYLEVLRWYPVAPLAIPRVTTTNDVYNGFFIPKGTIVVPNMWAMTHDEAVYHNPNEFLPERFLNENGELNTDMCNYMSNLGFGFGRRCNACVLPALQNLHKSSFPRSNTFRLSSPHTLISERTSRVPGPQVGRCLCPPTHIQISLRVEGPARSYSLHRVCPGRHLASDTVWLAIATILSVYNIRHAKDEHGNDIPVSGEYTNALISHHEPFECSVTPRSDAARDLIVNSISV